MPILDRRKDKFVEDQDSRVSVGIDFPIGRVPDGDGYFKTSKTTIDAIKNNITGYICNGNDLNSIYENIIKFFKDDNYKILGSNAFEFSKSFKWNKIIKQYLNLI